MSIGTKLRKLRLQNNKMSQEELAYKLGIAQTSISNFEADKTIPDFVVIEKICEEFGVGLGYFSEKEGDNFTFEKVEKNKNSNIGCKIDVINNNFPEGILENIITRLGKLEKIIQENNKDKSLN